MCLLPHEPSWKSARLFLIGLVASYCSRRIYQDLQAPVRPVRHACRFLRNRERNNTVLEICRLLCHSETFVACQYCPRDARRLIRHSDRCDARVAPLHHGLDPTTVSVVATIHEVHDRPGALYKPGPEISVAALCDTAQFRLASTGSSHRSEPQPGCKLPAIPELRWIAHAAHERGRDNRSDSRNSSEPLASFIAFEDFGYLSDEFIEPLLQGLQLLEIHQSEASEQGRDVGVGVID